MAQLLSTDKGLSCTKCAPNQPPCRHAATVGGRGCAQICPYRAVCVCVCVCVRARAQLLATETAQRVANLAIDWMGGVRGGSQGESRGRDERDESWGRGR